MKWSVIGHERQKKIFSRILASGSFAHAYLFSGPAMVGKRSFALEFIAVDHREAVPGSQDPYLTVVSHGERDSIPIDDIRELRRALSLTAPSGIRRFIVIDDAERMTHEASNALLKILEEPPSDVVFVLISSQPGSLPDTVRSRCHEVKFSSVSEHDSATFIAERKIPVSLRNDMLILAAGRPGLVVSLMEKNTLEQAVADSKALDLRLKDGIAERLVWAKELAARDDLESVVVGWIAVQRRAMGTDNASPVRLHALLELQETLGNPSLNARLAVEHFLLTV